MTGDASWYPGSRLARRMAVLIRMNERGLKRDELADLTGMTPGLVLEVYLHTPAERARLAVALGWPPDHFDDASAGGRAVPLPPGKPRSSQLPLAAGVARTTRTRAAGRGLLRALSAVTHRGGPPSEGAAQRHGGIGRAASSGPSRCPAVGCSGEAGGGLQGGNLGTWPVRSPAGRCGSR